MIQTLNEASRSRGLLFERHFVICAPLAHGPADAPV